jgi:MoaA/NifB/PqqE/SkfB family radical SAM enzyme
MDLDFPAFISFTVTNACNLRCQMCGQWSAEGYVRGGHGYRGRPLAIEEWKRLVDEAAAHGITSLLLRGGEPFLLPGIVELLEHANARGLFVSIDSNGTRLADFAAELVRLGRLHVTISVDGREDVHDAVRGVPGCFRQIERGLARLAELDGAAPRRVSRSICFTISPWSLPSLGEMPAVARRLGVDSITIVPYCYVPPAAGEAWTREVRELTGAEAFSWRGFQRDGSGVDCTAFAAQYEHYRATLDGLFEYPYMALTPDEYRAWFADAAVWVGRHACDNAERLIDVQPTGEANCCVDLPDILLGNVREASIAEIWNGGRARRFRERRRAGPLAACQRCVARHMATPRDAKGRPVFV